MGVNLSLEGYFEVSVNQTRLSRLTKPALLWFPPRWESICPMKGSLRDDLGDQPRRSPRAELDWNPATYFGNQDVDVVKDDPVVFSTLAAKINCCIYMLLYNFFYFCFSFFLHYLFFVSFLFYNICFLFLLLFLLSLFYYGPLAFTCFFLLLLQMDHDLICLEIFFFL